jgi:asparagine N-glycosylation enzyme membrane subunit Stt3
MMLVFIIGAFAVGFVMLFANDKHHEEWKRRNPKGVYYPGTKSSNFALVLLGIAVFAVFIWLDPEIGRSILEGL